MTVDVESKIDDEIAEINRTREQQKKLGMEKKLKEKAESEARQVQRNPPTALQATSMEFRWNVLMSWLWKQGVSEEALMKCYTDEQRLFDAEEAKQRAIDQKAQALADVEKEEERLKLLKLEYPFRRIE